MVTGTKACGWPLMANCILHSSFVNCCLPSSYFLLGHGTKPQTGGIRNGTSALQPSSSTFAFHLSLSVPPFLLSPCRVCSPDPVKSFLFQFSLRIRLHFFSSIFCWLRYNNSGPSAQKSAGLDFLQDFRRVTIIGLFQTRPCM